MRIVFMGTPDFAVPSLAALLTAGHTVTLAVTQADKPVGRHQTLTPPPVKQYALEHGIPVFQPRTLRNDESFARIAAEKPEVIVVVAYGKILPASLLNLPPFGAVNVHGSLLPKYRGAAPIQWAVLNGDAVAGVTTMQMDAGIDTGDMLQSCSREVPEDMTAGELFELLSADGARLLCDTLEGLENGTLHPQKQDGAAATMAPMLDKAMCPLDFQKSAKALHDQVRGLQPWPTATCRLGDTVLKIHKTRVGGHTTEDAGIIVSLSPLSVACGDGGVLQILELQYPGSRRMAAADFLRGHPLCCGDRLQ